MNNRHTTVCSNMLIVPLHGCTCQKYLREGDNLI